MSDHVLLNLINKLRKKLIRWEAVLNILLFFCIKFDKFKNT